jgi:hypothetical protein
MHGNKSGKWKLANIVSDEGNTKEAFETILPYARWLTAQLLPWQDLTTEDVQRLLDGKYGPGTFNVASNPGWMKIVRH